MSTHTRIATSLPMIQSAGGIFRLPAWRTLPLVQSTSTRGQDFHTFLRRWQLTPQDVVWAEQTHGAGIALVSSRDLGQEYPGCDALVTRKMNVPIAIRTADCAPLFVYDALHQAIGIAHVGWRGLAANLPTALIQFFQVTFTSDPAQLHVGIGPSVRKCCYRIQQDVAGQLPDDCESTTTGIVLDIPTAIMRRALQAGISESHISDGAICTSCAADQCYSVRRDGADTGRHLSLLILTRQ